MEALSCFLRRAMEGGYISGVKVRGRGGDGVEVSHLLFVDNSLVFMRPPKIKRFIYVGFSYGLKLVWGLK